MFSTLHAILRYKNLGGLLRAAWRVAQNKGITGLYRESRKFASLNIAYSRWIKHHDTLSEQDRIAINRHMATFSQPPLISVLTPTYNTTDKWLRRAIESIRSQIYPHWELCIADDASTAPHVRAVLEEYARMDERIRVVFREQNGHISASTNSALDIARGEFVALFDHDDELPAHALYMVASAINENPGVNLIYSDEDRIDKYGRRSDPYFKPDWNPDLLNGQNMVSHLGVFRTEVLKRIGGFKTGLEGAQDWDVALRMAEQIHPSTILHLPYVLYHWRAIPGSTAIRPEEKTYVANACLKVVREHLQRTNQPASIEPAFSSFIRVRYQIPTPAPLVSIILLGESANPDELIRRTRYMALEIIPCTSENCGSPAETLNSAANRARGELLCFLDSELLPENEDWLNELVGQASRKEIGAVGPIQLNVDGSIVNALTLLSPSPNGNRVYWSLYRGMNHQEKGVAGRAALQQNVTVLAPGCLILRTETFWLVNGLDAARYPTALFEPDLCLRLVQAGYRNLWNPNSRMVYAGNKKPCRATNNQYESEVFQKQWQDYLYHDPSHNPNLNNGADSLPFACPPRLTRPWQYIP